jgi:hypothetical protein
MKIFVALIVSALLAGCLSYKPDQRVVGNFKALSGGAIDIRSDGRIIFVSGEKQELVGLVTIAREEPLSIHVIAPDTSPLVGTKIVFSSDRKEIKVAWQSAIVGSPRPTVFRKE